MFINNVPSRVWRERMTVRGSKGGEISDEGFCRRRYRLPQPRSLPGAVRPCAAETSNQSPMLIATSICRNDRVRWVDGHRPWSTALSSPSTKETLQAGAGLKLDANANLMRRLRDIASGFTTYSRETVG